jgi:hypothetical protein
MQIRTEKGTRDADRCLILRFELEGKHLRIWGLGDDSDRIVKKLSDAGELKLVGQVGQVVTADSLVRYLRKNGGEKLFKDGGFIFNKEP